MRKIYISGKITDLDPEVVEKNKQKFYDAENFLKDKIPDAIIYNPVEIGRRADDYIDYLSYRQILYLVMDYLWQSDTIYMLKGWEESPGAQAEHALAKALKLKIIYECNEL